MSNNIIWFRKDLRISDNPALCHASKSAILPIYILDPEENLGSASMVWLNESLKSLNSSLSGRLQIYSGNPVDVLQKIFEANDVSGIYLNRCYEPWRIDSDAGVEKLCASKGVDFNIYNASLLHDPLKIKTGDGNYYKVYTPFKKALLQIGPDREVMHAPSNMSFGENKCKSNYVFKKEQWQQKFYKHWEFGEAGAQCRLKEFLADGLDGYKVGRDFPGQNHVSRLSPHLHFGEISPHQVWKAVEKTNAPKADSDHFISELIWREFSYYLLTHFPELPKSNFNPKFNKFPWHKNSEAFKKWTKGETGCPIVDAGMRQLWETGYIHNRVRMVVASFLVKNLMIDWREGAAWFWDCLVDADLANNSASWQWVAGSGADAAPYFRIFNPTLQGEKFDPSGSYIKSFVPELANVSAKDLFDLSPENAKKCNYPTLIADLQRTRDAALSAYKDL